MEDKFGESACSTSSTEAIAGSNLSSDTSATAGDSGKMASGTAANASATDGNSPRRMSDHGVESLCVKSQADPAGSAEDRLVNGHGSWTGDNFILGHVNLDKLKREMDAEGDTDENGPTKRRKLDDVIIQAVDLDRPKPVKEEFTTNELVVESSKASEEIVDEAELLNRDDVAGNGGAEPNAKISAIDDVEPRDFKKASEDTAIAPEVTAENLSHDIGRVENLSFRSDSKLSVGNSSGVEARDKEVSESIEEAKAVVDPTKKFSHDKLVENGVKPAAVNSSTGIDDRADGHPDASKSHKNQGHHHHHRHHHYHDRGKKSPDGERSKDRDRNKGDRDRDRDRGHENRHSRSSSSSSHNHHRYEKQFTALCKHSSVFDRL